MSDMPTTKITWNLSGSLEEQVKEIHDVITDLANKYGYGYFAFVLCKFFGLATPYFMRKLWDVRCYQDKPNDSVFDLIHVHRTLEEIAVFVQKGNPVSVRCYHCGKQMEQVASPGQPAMYFTCKSCSGSGDTLPDAVAMQVHQAIEREKEGYRG